MMKFIRKLTAAAMILCCIFSLTACKSFYQMFVDEEDTSDGVYFTVYNKDSSEKALSEIPELSFMRGDLRDEIKAHDLSFEVTLTFDLETDNEASLSFYYYHNRENEDADDYCQIGSSHLGTYTMENDKIIFKFEPDGYNTAFYNVGSDFADLEAFQKFSYAGDGSCGIWAYANTTYEYEETAQILEDVIKTLPTSLELTVSGKKIVSWKAAE